MKRLWVILFVISSVWGQNPCTEDARIKLLADGYDLETINNKCKEFIKKSTGISPSELGQIRAESAYWKYRNTNYNWMWEYARGFVHGKTNSLVIRDWFLSNIENLKQIKELDKGKYEQLYSELDKMTENFLKEWKENMKVVKTVQTTIGRRELSNRQKDAQVSEIIALGKYYRRKYRGMSEEYYEALLQGHADAMPKYNYITEERQITSNRKIVLQNKVLKREQPEWSDIVKYIGGYSELAKKGLTKNDISKFEITTVLESITITGNNTCVAEVVIKGDENYGHKYYKLYKPKFDLEGTYTIDNMNYAGIFNAVEGLYGSPKYNFNFESTNPRVPSSKISMEFSEINNQSIDMARPYHKAMVQMIDDLIINEDLMNYSRELQSILMEMIDELEKKKRITIEEDRIKVEKALIKEEVDRERRKKEEVDRERRNQEIEVYIEKLLRNCSVIVLIFTLSGYFW